MIKLFDPFVGKEEVRESSKILKSKFWSSGSGIGNVEEFENKFSNFVGCKNWLNIVVKFCFDEIFYRLNLPVIV